MNIKSIISEIESDILSIEKNASIFEETGFDARADAIDFIDFHIIDRLESLLQDSMQSEDLDILKQRAERIKHELEKIDVSLFTQLREMIRIGIYKGSSFKEMTGKYLGAYFGNNAQSGNIGYDNLDVFINGLLTDQIIPEALLNRESEMVFYQKTPARIIFEMIASARLGSNDVFFDLGAGLGQVTILASLMSQAAVKGIEYDPAFCNYANTCASQLNLSNVEFINIDARNGDYSAGTVFFMYTPFGGKILQDVLEMLQTESRKRAIRIFTYGPCSAEIALQSWLNCVNGPADDPYKLYEFWSH
jgi:precorrin-6B methylase 2